mmetsp:Transcript_56620/g.93131  ORF Transcript_56620/g.93131 Transcript_56620/m.93131 type:complete len:237 (+) Transcript_56620:113-823(+)
MGIEASKPPHAHQVSLASHLHRLCSIRRPCRAGERHIQQHIDFGRLLHFGVLLDHFSLSATVHALAKHEPCVKRFGRAFKHFRLVKARFRAWRFARRYWGLGHVELHIGHRDAFVDPRDLLHVDLAVLERRGTRGGVRQVQVSPVLTVPCPHNSPRRDRHAHRHDLHLNLLDGIPFSRSINRLPADLRRQVHTGGDGHGRGFHPAGQTGLHPEHVLQRFGVLRGPCMRALLGMGDL